ncbi:MAG: hypothetical protein E7222_10045 [Clostridiales bacterium]|nr:hypothetical protein [Clostridiales bacterium]
MSLLSKNRPENIKKTVLVSLPLYIPIPLLLPLLQQLDNGIFQINFAVVPHSKTKSHRQDFLGKK